MSLVSVEELISKYALHGINGYVRDREDAEECVRRIKVEAKREMIHELSADMALRWPLILDEFEAGEVCDWLDSRLERLV